MVWEKGLVKFHTSASQHLKARVSVCFQGISRLPSAFVFLR